MNDRPTIIDIGTDEDAGAWLAALPFCPNIEVSEYRAGVPCPSTARPRDEAGNTPARLVPADSFAPLVHDQPNSTGEQHDPA